MIIPFSASTDRTPQGVLAVFARDVLSAGFVEIVDTHGLSSAQMHIESCLKEAPTLHFHAAFIEAQPRWCPDYLSEGVLSHTLWTRCDSGEQALKAADVLVRDENFQLVVIDLRQLSKRALQQIPQGHWYRLQRINSNQSSTLVVATPAPMIAAAHMRVEIQAKFDMNSFHTQRPHLASRVQSQITRRRSHTISDKGWIPIDAQTSKRIQAS